MKIMKLVTPKVGAKHELLFNKPALGDTKFLAAIAMNLGILCCVTEV
jgi:hypothetical protein